MFIFLKQKELRFNVNNNILLKIFEFVDAKSHFVNKSMLFKKMIEKSIMPTFDFDKEVILTYPRSDLKEYNATPLLANFVCIQNIDLFISHLVECKELKKISIDFEYYFPTKYVLHMLDSLSLSDVHISNLRSDEIRNEVSFQLIINKIIKLKEIKLVDASYIFLKLLFENISTELKLSIHTYHDTYDIICLIKSCNIPVRLTKLAFRTFRGTSRYYDTVIENALTLKISFNDRRDYEDKNIQYLCSLLDR